MVTGFEILGHDANLRSHWKARFGAFFMDFFVSLVPVSLALYLLGMDHILGFGIIFSTVFYLFTVIPESLTGSSMGKRFLGLQVHAADGGRIAGRVCIRNLNRLLWFVLPLLDFALGMATRGDPRQRLLDRAAGTKVVHRDEKERHSKAVGELEKARDEEAEGPEGERCNECGGSLIRLPDDKLQCEDCGLIQ